MQSHMTQYCTQHNRDKDRILVRLGPLKNIPQLKKWQWHEENALGGLRLSMCSIEEQAADTPRFSPSLHTRNYVYRARRFPLPDGPGQVKLPVGQVDLDRFFFFISYKQIEEFQNSWSRASDDFEKRQALCVYIYIYQIPYASFIKNKISNYINVDLKFLHNYHRPSAGTLIQNGPQNLTKTLRILRVNILATACGFTFKAT